MQENQNLQDSKLFDESITYIDCNTKFSNIIHKNTVTSTDNNTKKALNNIYIWFDSPLSHNVMSSLM